MVYLDNAATSYPKPASVLDSLKKTAIQLGGNPGRSGHVMSMNAAQAIYRTREEAASFFGAQPEHVIFTCNCTHALNIAIKGVIKKGGHVIISCLEHNAVTRPLYRLSQDGEATYSVAEVFSDPAKTVASFESLIQPETQAIICTHASNVSGKVLPIEQLGKLCKRYHLTFIVDAAQTAGVLPIHVKRMGIDLLCIAGHKGLYGISGTGMLILGSDRLIKPLIEGGTGSLSLQQEQPDFYPDRLESGTVNTVGIVSLYHGMKYLNHRGNAAAYEHEMELCHYARERLSQLKEIHFLEKHFDYATHVPVLSFTIADKDSEEVGQRLSDSGIAVRSGLHCAPFAHRYYGTLKTGAIRMSPSIFSTKNEIEYFVKQVKKISKID